MYDFLEEEEDPGVDIPAVRRGANFNCRDKTWENGKSASIRRRSENLPMIVQYLINRVVENSYRSLLPGFIPNTIYDTHIFLISL